MFRLVKGSEVFLLKKPLGRLQNAVSEVEPFGSCETLYVNSDFFTVRLPQVAVLNGFNVAALLALFYEPLKL